MSQKKKFEELVACLLEYNKTDPKVTYAKVNKLVEELDAYQNIKGFKSLKKFDRTKLSIGVMIFIIAIAGLINFSGELTAAYYGGLVFFLAGIFTGLYVVKGFGILFLFSHGATGLGLMLFPILGLVFDNPVYTDGSPVIIYIYIALIAILVIAAFLSTIAYNLGDNLKKIQNAQLIPWILFTTAIVLTTIGPKILPLLYRINI